MSLAGVHRLEWLSGGIHLVILTVAVIDRSGRLWPHALAAMAAVSLAGWVSAYRRYRKIHDLPSSRIASAAQGYVELIGRSRRLPDAPLVSKITGLPCCWFRYSIERRTAQNRWVRHDRGTSQAPFLLVDDTGECVIEPEGAEVLSTRRQQWTQGDYRYTEWLLLPEGRLYAIGEFSTRGGAHAELDERADVGALLADWKRDAASLLERFDLDGDGTLDLREWELARLQAQREVRRTHAQIRLRDGVHRLGKPRDGRLFLLSNELPDRLGRRFAFWSVAHLLIFFIAGVAALLLAL
jgi:cbb3-type cytochrome oxidase subunit 3